MLAYRIFAFCLGSSIFVWYASHGQTNTYADLSRLRTKIVSFTILLYVTFCLCVWYGVTFAQSVWPLRRDGGGEKTWNSVERNMLNKNIAVSRLKITKCEARFFQSCYTRQKKAKRKRNDKCCIRMAASRAFDCMFLLDWTHTAYICRMLKNMNTQNSCILSRVRRINSHDKNAICSYDFTFFFSAFVHFVARQIQWTWNCSLPLPLSRTHKINW